MTTLTTPGTRHLAFDQLSDTITIEDWFVLGGQSIENFSFVAAGTVAAGQTTFSAGTDADDVITGGSGLDWAFGGFGDDVISGGGGADILNGGSGDDVLSGGSGVDRIIGGAGYDIVSYADNTDAGLHAYLSEGVATEAEIHDVVAYLIELAR